MPDRHAFLRAICEGPDDDGPRLVFADWLEEQGDPRGEFIRLQVQRHQLPVSDLDGRRHLSAREDELTRQYGAQWRRELPYLSGIAWGVFNRGMVPAIEVADFASFTLHTETIFQRSPVREVWFRKLGADGARLLAQTPFLSRISNLKLTNCALGDEGVEALAGSPHIAGVRDLMLNGNNLSDVTARHFANSRFLTDLTMLSLADNHIGDEGAEILAATTTLARLKEVYLAVNRIGGRGAAALRRRWGERVYL
jgi:uncharacterized protein (TIGR02996 family)